MELANDDVEQQQQQCYRNSPSTSSSSAMDLWAEVDNAILRARAHLFHSRSDQENANLLVECLSDMLEKVRDARERPLGLAQLEDDQEDDEEGEDSVEDEGDGESNGFESMILCSSNAPIKKRSIQQQQQQSTAINSIQPPDRKRSSATGGMNLKKRSMVAPAPLQGMAIPAERRGTLTSERRSSVYVIGTRRASGCSATAIRNGAAEGVDPPDPILIRSLPHLAIVACAFLWLLLGAAIFQWIDPKIGEKPFHRALLYAFELCTTIGWGDSHSSNAWSQLFCTVFTLLGVPFLFSAFANLGRLITEFYCVDWLFLSAVVRRKSRNAAHLRRRFPLRFALNLLFLHQCLGVLIYSGILRDFPVVATVYFSITSMATIGLGDFSPEPANLGETVLALVYFSSGIILLSAFYLSIAYHFQTFFYISLREFLHCLYVRLWKRRQKDVHQHDERGLSHIIQSVRM